MADVQVKCINKQPRNDTHEGITHLGGEGFYIVGHHEIMIPLLFTAVAESL